MGKAAKAAPAKKNDRPRSDSLVHLHALAGALSGAIARFAVGPLDVLKIRFQVQLEPIAALGAGAGKYTSMRQALVTIVREEGIQGLWRGTVPGQLLAVPYTAVQFVALQQCRALAAARGLDRAPGVEFVAGAAAGAAGTAASYPFDLLRTTLAAQGEPRVYASMAAAARGVLARDGAAGLYRGLGVTLAEIVPYMGLQFGLFDALMRAADGARARAGGGGGGGGAAERRGAAAASLQTFVCGLAAGTAAKLATHPLDVAKKRFQVAGLERSRRYGARVAADQVRSLRACLADIVAREGVRGLYKGAAPSVIKAAPAAAVTLAAYDLILKALLAARAGGGGGGTDAAAAAALRPRPH